MRSPAAFQVSLLRLLRQAQGQRQQASRPETQDPEDLRRRSTRGDSVNATWSTSASNNYASFVYHEINFLFFIDSWIYVNVDFDLYLFSITDNGTCRRHANCLSKVNLLESVYAAWSKLYLNIRQNIRLIERINKWKQMYNRVLFEHIRWENVMLSGLYKLFLNV